MKITARPLLLKADADRMIDRAVGWDMIAPHDSRHPSDRDGKDTYMEERLSFTEENGKPVLRMKGNFGEVIVDFADQDGDSNLKQGLLHLILQSYEDSVLEAKTEKHICAENCVL